MNPITSTKNPKIKALLALKKPAERRKTGFFSIEGIREIKLAIVGQYEFVAGYYCPTIVNEADLVEIKKYFEPMSSVSNAVFNKIAVREDHGGVIIVAKKKDHHLKLLKLGSSPLLLILESIEKPGNLGAILRTADAATVDAVIVCDPKLDCYNPNVIRSSLGAIFTNQLALSTPHETIEWLKHNNISLYAAHIKSSIPYYEVDYHKGCAIALGTEADSLTPPWIEHADKSIVIPMNGMVDSLNVSTTAAILAFEAKKQRINKEQETKK